MSADIHARVHRRRALQRHATGDRWFVDETYVKVAGRWTYLHRAVDQHGQLIDVLLSQRRDGAAARMFFTRAMRFGPAPVEVSTDRAPVDPRVLEELAPDLHVLEQYANNVVEADHGRLKARLGPMRGLKRLASARTVASGHAFVQNLHRGHYELTAEAQIPAHCDRDHITGETQSAGGTDTDVDFITDPVSEQGRERSTHQRPPDRSARVSTADPLPVSRWLWGVPGPVAPTRC